MRISLKKAVDKLFESVPNAETFKYFVKRTLQQRGYGRVMLEEGQVIEIQDGFVTVVFTWDMISAVNNLTNEYVDLLSPRNAFKVFD